MKKLFILGLSLILLSSCNKKQVKMYQKTTVSSGFDTFISYNLATSSQEEFDETYEKSIQDFEYLNKLFDIYHTYDGLNNLKTINDMAKKERVKVDQPIIDLLDLSKKLYDLSNGEFDITMGPVLKVWHKYREEGLSLMEEGKLGNVPSLEELEEAKACVGWDKVEIDRTNMTVYLNQECASLDVGGIAKGFATEYAASRLNVEYGYINAGGNNRTLNKLDGTPWKLGIQNPSKLSTSNASLVAVEHLGPTSFVTSGDYERFYVASDGNFYSHIIDSNTLFPANKYNSVTILTKNSGIADAFSTILFTLDFSEGNKLIEEYNKNNPDDTISAIWISDKEGSITGDLSKKIETYTIGYTKDLEEKMIWK